MRRILNQAANATAKHKGDIFEILIAAIDAPRLGHEQTIGIIADKLCRPIWKIPHIGVHYQTTPRGQQNVKQKRTQK